MSHLAKLEQDHADLDSQLADELKSSSRNDIRCQELKRLKLFKKDEIAKIRRQTDHADPERLRA